ncbi:MAG: hypothetical protein L3J82_02825, partial [Planctomycetes bacterium]|nr:hypothetical protein [Planctomycetota bacterium]
SKLGSLVLAKRPQARIGKGSSAVGQDARHTHRPEADDTFLPAGGSWSPQKDNRFLPTFV